MKQRIFGFCLLLGSASAFASEGIRLHPGYIVKVHCEGRLLVSAVGNDSLVRLEALPKELGCGVLLKPLAPAGRTNLILETSAGTLNRTVEIQAVARSPHAEDLEFFLKGAYR